MFRLFTPSLHAIFVNAIISIYEVILVDYQGLVKSKTWKTDWNIGLCSESTGLVFAVCLLGTGATYEGGSSTTASSAAPAIILYKIKGSVDLC